MEGDTAARGQLPSLAFSLDMAARLHHSSESGAVGTKLATAAAATHSSTVPAEPTLPPPAGSVARGRERTGTGIRGCNKKCMEGTTQWGSV